jgi:hypothetical protein
MRHQILIAERGERIPIDVTFIDEAGRTATSTVVAELMDQDAPVLLGIKVDGRPVLLRSNDTVFHAGAPLETEQPGIVREIARRFRTFGGGEVRDASNPISHWTKDEPITFAMGVNVADVVRFVIEQLNAGRAC